jgi:carboxyl-terminal processing protease
VQPASISDKADRAISLAELRAKISEQYVTPVDENDIVQGAIKGMIGALGDPYSDYLTPEMLASMEKQLGGTLVGIGVQLELHEQRVRVVTALEGSPALQAGVLPGDVILQIDGKPAADLADAVKRIPGPQGTVVRLTIGREAGLDVELDITRSPIRLQTVKGFRRGADNRWDYLLDADRKLGYAQIAQFASATPQELRQAVESLKQQGLRGMILDLRSCPGGMLDSAVSVAKLFLAGGTIVSLHSRNGTVTTIQADPTSGLGDFPLIILVNGQTGSAAEVVAGALQDNRRAVVLGTRTIGKGSVQSLIKLENDSGAIKLTTSHYRLPSGRNIDKRPDEPSWGIDPDDGYFVPVEPAQAKAMHERRMSRDIIGRKSNEQPGSDAEITPQSIIEQLSDPQLAAALKTLIARVEQGEFEKVSDFSPAQVQQFLKRENALRRREAMLKDLEQLNRELAELEKK